jgi:hypothetical protein
MRENDFEARNGRNVVAGKVGGLGRFCLSRDPSPFDFAQVQDYGKNKGGKADADFCAALGNDKKKKRGRTTTKAKTNTGVLRCAQNDNCLSSVVEFGRLGV